ncbi:outer membrane beta-barrel protein [Pseudomonadota bacterium]
MVRKLTIKGSILGISVSLFALCGSVLAQNYDNPGLGQQPVISHPQDYKPLGVRAGAFMLHPGVQLGAQWTDNAFYANTDLKSDTIFHIRPYITAQSTWSRHSLNVRVAADFARYAKYSERDYEDYFLGISGRVDVKARSAFTYSLDYMNLHEGLNNRNSEQGIQPTRYDFYGGTVGYYHSFSRLNLSATFGMNWLDFDNVVGEDGDVIDNQDRDRKSTNLTLRVGYQAWIDKELFISYTGYTVDYAEEFDRNGYARSGDGYTINTGINLLMTERLQGDFFFSYYNRNFDDPRLPSNSGWRWILAGSAGVQWNPTDLTSVYGRISSSVQDTTDANATSFTNTLLSLRATHELLRNVQLNAFVSYAINDYEPIDPTLENTRTKDNVIRAGFGASWFINRYMYLNASYNYTTLDSSLPNDDFTTNTVWLLLGLEY